MEHPALLYDGREDFVGRMAPFVREGLEAGETVFVAANRDDLGALRDDLGSDGDAADWADTSSWHPHPARRLRAFIEIAARALDGGATRVHLAGEPLRPGGPAELGLEWQRYESVLNLALAPYPATLVCLYDSSRFDRELLESSRRTHATIMQGGREDPSADFVPVREFLEANNASVTPPPQSAAAAPAPEDLSPTRAFVVAEALRLGATRDRAEDLCIAANEVLTNGLIHGGGVTGLWVWADGDSVVCQVHDQAPSTPDPVAGYIPPPADTDGGRGLWMARQLVDLLQIWPDPTGVTTRLRLARG